MKNYREMLEKLLDELGAKHIDFYFEKSKEDVEILLEKMYDEIAKKGVELAEKLNKKYPDSKFPKFHFIYRKRKWNDKEECYLGWERKRGLLTQFNEFLLSGDHNDDFLVNTINPDKLPHIKYVISIKVYFVVYC